MRIQVVSLIFSISLVFASSPSLAETEWTIKSKNFIIQSCFNKAQTQARPIYKSMFYGKMSDVEYEAFSVSNNTQLLQSCQCVVNRISAEYQLNEVLGNLERVSSYTNTLAGSDGPCGLNVESLLADMRTRISGSR
jgi:hypothetical protein